MKAPIGVIDSGVGGLTVAKELIQQLPNESIIYIGDDARCPYGPRTTEEVTQFTIEMTEALEVLGIKMLVIACNTATAAALETVQERFDFPIIGVIEPGARAALQASERDEIVVLGTQGTVNSRAYDTAILRHAPHAKVQALACPSFVPVVESGDYKTDVAREIVDATLRDLDRKEFDTAILGCTHYPLLQHHIQAALPDAKIISSATETVVDVKRVLHHFGIESTQPDATYRFYTTGEVDKFRDIVEDWLQIQEATVEKIHLQTIIQSKK